MEKKKWRRSPAGAGAGAGRQRQAERPVSGKGQRGVCTTLLSRLSFALSLSVSLSRLSP